MDDTSVLQDDLRDMLRALGKPDGARPQSPHQVFRECIQDVERLVAALRRIAASNIYDMNTLHPNGCAQVAQNALNK